MNCDKTNIFACSHDYFNPIAPLSHSQSWFHGKFKELKGIVTTFKKHIVYLTHELSGRYRVCFDHQVFSLIVLCVRN